MTLSKQIDRWYQAGEHHETVNAILNMTDLEVTDSLIEDLAVAYNNLGQYQKAIDALRNTDCQNRTSPHWHYCMGYALYYAAMDSPDIRKQRTLLQGSFRAFTHALKLNPKKALEHECREFLSWIQEDLQKPAVPSCVPPQEGTFVCSVLLTSAWFDTDKFIEDVYRDWSVRLTPDRDFDRFLLFSVDDMEAVLTLIPSPIPPEEARKAAASNYLWPNGAKVVENHKAHLAITVLGPDASLMDRGLLLVKLAASCCLQLPAAGVFTGPSVYQAGLYRNLASVIKDGCLPVFNWVWIGLYETQDGYGGYTYGLELFGKDEIEVVDTHVKPHLLRSFLGAVASYVLEGHVILQDGDTIGFHLGESLPVTLSPGIALSGNTLKIPCNITDAP
ncbi:MAG: DUF4261 domain-containing protein [Hungatella sp.]|nr:DUF4261 domain-containing protein [Hungatella sp.]